MAENYTLSLMNARAPFCFSGEEPGYKATCAHSHTHITLTHVTLTHVTHPLTHSHHTLTSHTSHTHTHPHHTHTHR